MRPLMKEASSLEDSLIASDSLETVSFLKSSSSTLMLSAFSVGILADDCVVFYIFFLKGIKEEEKGDRVEAKSTRKSMEGSTLSGEGGVRSEDPRTN